MEKIKLTPWFPRRTKPVRKGVYETFDPTLECNYYNVWDGETWHYGWPELKDHRPGSHYDDPMPTSHISKWRGLAQAPKGKRA